MLLIGDRWLDTGKHLKVRSPIDGRDLGQVAVAGSGEVEAAVGAARAALARPLSAHRRAQLLHAVRAGLEADREEMARLIALETGKVFRECQQEVDRGATTLRWSAEEAVRVGGEVLPCDVTEQEHPRQAMAVRVPLGVVAAITPFNFPVNVPLHKLGPALAAGNATILKPAPKTPLTANRLAQLFRDAGWPAGWVNVLHGEDEVVRLLAAADIQAVNLTGGWLAGQSVSRHAAGKHLLLELGGNDPIILDRDADLDAALPVVVQHRFGSSGQRCTSCKRLFVAQPLLGRVLRELRQRLEALVVGDPFDPATDLGPLVSEAAARKVEAQVEAMRAAGATIHLGGRRRDNYFWPTLVSGLDPTHPAALEEVFGPVLPVYPFDQIQQAAAWCNASPYGLQAGVFTNSLQTVQYLFRTLEVGTLVVNQGPNFRVESLPFGGVKRSGLGREGVRFALEEMTTIKTLIF